MKEIQKKRRIEIMKKKVLIQLRSWGPRTLIVPRGPAAGYAGLGQGQYGSWAGAGAVTEICSPFSSKRPKTRSDYGRTDGPTN